MQEIAIDGRQRWCLQPGRYAYVGSAMNGLWPRLKRHLDSHKRLHWHIDYLLQKATISNIIICPSDDQIECTIARSLSNRLELIPGFGSSDCKCCSHLFFSEGNMKDVVLDTIESIPLPVETFTPSSLERMQNHKAGVGKTKVLSIYGDRIK
jgi:Uri superfamily endonuclease